LILVILFYFSCFTSYKPVKVKAEEPNPLKIEKIIGLSKEPGTFSLSSFSLYIDKSQLTEQDDFTLSVNVENLEHCASIDLTLQYPKELISIESSSINEFLKEQLFEASTIDQSAGFFNIKTKSSNGLEASGSGTMFELECKAKRSGLAYLDIADIKLFNRKGEKVSYDGKKALSVLIKPRV
jgi:hypothetical protein